MVEVIIPVKVVYKKGVIYDLDDVGYALHCALENMVNSKHENPSKPEDFEVLTTQAQVNEA